jgi:hypothetical protein
VVAVTENPVRIWDWERKAFIREVLLIGGVQLPENGRIPLLDSHNRTSVTGILGSARNFDKKETTLEAEVAFSETDAGRNAALNVRDGHLTDFSVGYYPLEWVYLKEGESREIAGRTFTGPLKVTTRWRLRELSVTAIGADRAATARSEQEEEVAGREIRGDQAPMAPDPPAAEPGSDPAFDPTSDPRSGAAKAAETPPSERSAAVSAGSAGKKTGTGVIDLIFYAIAAFMVLAFIRGLF